MNYKSIVDKKIKSIISSKPQSILKEAIEYSLFPSGKRIRPILCLISCEAVGGNPLNALDIAVAIEFIHTYSLVHDDIMDRDEIRREKPSVYKKYGIPIAILVGDGLLTLAFEILSDYPAVSKEIAKAIGINGMVLGQTEDVLRKKQDVKREKKISLNKTAKLFSASCVAGGIIGGGNKEQIAALRKFGENFGLCFQIKDDIEDRSSSELRSQKREIDNLVNKARSFLSIFGEKGKNLEDSLIFWIKK